MASAEYYQLHRDEILAKAKMRHLLNPEKAIERVRAWRDQNPDKANSYSRAQTARDPEGARLRRRKWTDQNPSFRADYDRVRRQRHLDYRLRRVLRSRLSNALRGAKVGSAVRDLGCSIPELRAHLTARFYPHSETGEVMSWDNYGDWHIDHIKALVKFDLTVREQFLRACHYTNLQPLWADDNWRKGVS